MTLFVIESGRLVMVVSHGFPNLLVVVMLKIAEAIEPSFDAMLEGRKSEALGEALEVQIPKKLCLAIPFSSFLGCSWLPDQCVSVPSFSMFFPSGLCKSRLPRLQRKLQPGGKTVVRIEYATAPAAWLERWVWFPYGEVEGGSCNLELYS